jgi:hypothetical protein
MRIRPPERSLARFDKSGSVVSCLAAKVFCNFHVAVEMFAALMRGGAAVFIGGAAVFIGAEGADLAARSGGGETGGGDVKSFAG